MPVGYEPEGRVFELLRAHQKNRKSQSAIFLDEHKGLRPTDAADLNLYLSILSARIFDSRVVLRMPSRSAAPDGPATRPRLFSSAASMISRS